MIPILDPDTYTALSDTDGTEHTMEQVAYAELAVGGAEDRRRNAYTRGLCLSFFDWFKVNFQSKQPPLNDLDVATLLNGFMVTHLSALDMYLHEREEKLGPYFGVPGCTTENLMLKIVISTARGSSQPDFVRLFNELGKSERRRYITACYKYKFQMHCADQIRYMPTCNVVETIERGRNLGDEICEGGMAVPCE